MNTVYENNISLTRSERERLAKQNYSQKEIVLEVLSRSGRPLTDAEIHQGAQEIGLIGSETPLTSMRRARSNLKKEGRIEQAVSKRDGGFGVQTKTWQIKQASPAAQSDMFGPPSRESGPYREVRP